MEAGISSNVNTGDRKLARNDLAAVTGNDRKDGIDMDRKYGLKTLKIVLSRIKYSKYHVHESIKPSYKASTEGEENMHIDLESSQFFTGASDDDPVAINIESGVDVKENPDTQFIGNHKLKIAKVVLQRVDSIYYTAGSERTNLYASKLRSYIKVEDGLRPVNMVSDDTLESRGNSTLNFIKDEPLNIIDECLIKQEPPIDWKTTYIAFEDPHCHATPSSTDEFTNLPAVSANNEELPTDGRDSSIDPSSATVESKICDLCGDIFRSLPLVRKHIVEEHLAVGLHDRQISDAKSNEFRLSQRGKLFSVPCKICGKLLSKSSLQKHMNVHSGEKKHECNECGKAFSLKAYLMRHLRSHSGEKPFECTECGKTFTNEPHLNGHLRSHSGEKPYECSECGKAFKQKMSMMVHLRSHSGKKPFECTDCEKTFLGVSSFKCHLIVHSGEKNYECPQCGKAFALKGSMNRHLRSHSGERPFKCPQCERAFARKSTMMVHLRTHTGEKPFECPECGKTFSCDSSFTYHLRPHRSEKPYICRLCGKAFTWKTCMDRHLRSHSGEKPYECAQCGKTFTRKQNMMIHLRAHDGEKPYECAECGKKLSCLSSFTNHRRVHTGQKPYVCPQCGKCFTQKAGMDRHMRSHRGEKPFECSQCGKAFTRKVNMMLHIRTHDN